MTMKRRTLSLLVSLCLVLGLLPAGAFAQDTIQYVALGDSITTGYKLFHTQIGVRNRLDGGRRRVKKYLWSFVRTAPAGAGQAVTCSTSGMGLRLK